MTQEEIQQVDIESIRVSPFQPRRRFSDEELDALINSIEDVGLIHPPVVRPITTRGKLLYYELIAGERRWRACKKAGKTTLSVIVRQAADELAAKATLIENVQRVDLDPIEMANALKRLVDAFQMTQEEVATKIGKKRSTVANYLRLLSLPKKVQEGVSCGEISMGHAKAILSLSGEKLQHLLHELIVEKSLTVRQAERQSVKMAPTLRRKKQATELSQEKIHLKELEQKFQEKFGTKVSIDPTSHNQGKLSIYYYSAEDLENLMQILQVN